MQVETLVVFLQSRVPCFTAHARHVARLRAALPGVRVIWRRTPQTFQRILPQAEAVTTWTFRQEWFDRAPRLRLLATPAAGRDWFPAAPPSRVKVRFGSHHGPIMAETVVGLMLGVNRGLFEAHRRQLAGELWPSAALRDSRLLAGSHAVILGFGHIGQHVGRLLKAFDVRVTGIRRTPDAARPRWFRPGDEVAPLRRLDALLPRADHLILVLPGDTDTDHLMDARRLARLPQHAVIYNIGRGNCLDEAALARALETRALRGACLDVFAVEPIEPDAPLARNLPGLIRLPHASAFDGAYLDRHLDELIAWLKP